MSLSKIITSCFIIPFLVFSCGCTDAPENNSLDLGSNKTPVVINHFFLNPSSERPVDYPVDIELVQIKEYLKKQSLKGQGCGGCTWEGKSCGFFMNSYGVIKTPWLAKPVEVDASYAQTEKGAILIGLTIDHNKYQRNDSLTNTLVWEHNYAAESVQSEVRRVLSSGDSAARKKMLSRFQESFQNVDLSKFPPEKRSLLAQQLERCETDADPVVVKQAQELRAGILTSLSQDKK